MSEEQKQRERSLKKEVAERLMKLAASGWAGYESVLDATDMRLRQYADTVALHPDSHCIWELLALDRYISLSDRYLWKAKRVKNRIKWAESVKYSGVSGRSKFRLTPVEVFIYANIYGFSLEDGRRLIRDAYVEVPRKFGKTTFMAGLASGELTVFGEDNGQVYVGANSYNQAKICFDEIRQIVRGIDSDERHIRVNREKIFFLKGNRNAFAQCLSSNAKTLDGLNASLIIMDEYSQARSAELKNVLTSSMGVRKNPLTIVITTASDQIDGPFAHELEGVMSVLRGEVDNDRLFALLYMPDVDDAEDSPQTWAKVQPHLGVTVQPDYYEIEWQRAQLSAENMMTFRTKLLNVFAKNEEEPWLTRKKANSLLGNYDAAHVVGRPVTACSFDLSVRDDFSAVSYMSYSQEERRFYVHTDYYLPEGTLKWHVNKDMYKAWHEQGYLKLCKGDVIDVKMIASDIMSRSKVLHIMKIGYDAYKSKDLVNILMTMPGGRNSLEPYKQTYGNFNLPVDSFEMLAFNNPVGIVFNGNPINAYCLSNCVLDVDNLENRKPVKMSPNAKIDGVITMLMCLGMLNSMTRRVGV